MSAHRQNRGTASEFQITDSEASGIVNAKRSTAANKRSFKKSKVSKQSKAAKRTRSDKTAKPRMWSAAIKKALTARKALDPRSDPVEKVIGPEQDIPLGKGPEVSENKQADGSPAVESIVPTSCKSSEALVLIDLPSSAASGNSESIQGVSEPPGQSLVPAVNPHWIALRSALGMSWKWLQQRLKSQQSRKRLRVCESVSLGEKRFVAVIQVDEQQFLVGGSSSSISTLAHLERSQEFSDVFRQRYQQDPNQA